MTVQNSPAGSLDSHRAIGELVAERPARARLFEHLHVDYCCGGQRTLAEACSKAGLQLETVQAALLALDEIGTDSAATETSDWRMAGSEALCEHIVAVHHEFLRRGFPRIESLLGTVVRVHGEEEPALGELPRVFGTIRSALEPHLASEETELFPAILAAEAGGPAVAVEVLAGHEYEHEQVGAALTELRTLCHDFDRRTARCNTHRALLDALEELEMDVHQHVHEENNVLFARARSAGANAIPRHRSPSRANAIRPPAVPQRVQTLPACCQGWVANQGERWARTRRGS